jgi:hypothetical protein
VNTFDSRDEPGRAYGRDEFGDSDPMPATTDHWNFRPDAGWTTGSNLAGYHVQATDGSIGKVDECNNAVNESFLVVDTGPWIFGRKVMVPAGSVTNLDHTEGRVYLDRTKAQVKASPEFDPDLYTEPTYRDKVGSYYDETYRTASFGPQ